MLSLILREKQRLRMFENRVLRRISGPKWDEIIGGLRNLHNDEFHNFYPSANITTMIKWGGFRWIVYTYIMQGTEEECIQGFGGKTG
jgi:hypothetical protein